MDLPTLRIVEEALIAFPGVVLVVSHDRYFLNRVCTGILAFEGDGNVVYSVGDYDYYMEKIERASELLSAPNEQRQTSGSKPASKLAPERGRKVSFKEQKELEGMEAAILQVEQNISRIEDARGH